MGREIGKVFISHSSKDKPFVDQLASDLAAHAIPVWYDKLDMRIGDSIPGKINEGISEAKYFLIVLSPDAMSSRWVQEELNAALMRQIASNGTFLLPVLLSDCDIPPLLSHRQYVDFWENYEDALRSLLSIWGKDAEVTKEVGSKPLYPWPDFEISDQQFVYLHSTRFDKFFRMNCEFEWTADYAIDYIVETLDLPWNKELPELGMRWSFSYGLIYNNESITLSEKLKDAGIVVGSTVRMNIRGTYEDLYERELRKMWDGSIMYKVGGAMRREAELREAIRMRGALTSERLKNMANSCFSHV